MAAVAQEEVGPAEAAVATETEVVHPGNRVRPKFESKHVAVNDKGCATVRVHFGCTSRHVAKFRNQVNLTNTGPGW